MSRKHALVVAAIFGLAAVIGFTALSRTVQLGSASRHANDALIVAKTQQLNTFERSLHRQLAATTGSAAAAIAPTPKPRMPRVVYVRPAPIVVHKHLAGGEAENENMGESQGFDD